MRATIDVVLRDDETPESVPAALVAEYGLESAELVEAYGPGGGASVVAVTGDAAAFDRLETEWPEIRG